MKVPVWLSKEVVLAAHDEMLAEHGGAAGIRDEGLLDSALGRPENLFAYGKASLFSLAAGYASGIVRNHPFIDGNKRTGFLAAYIFLARNGQELTASEAEATLTLLALAESKLTEEEFGGWLKKHCRPGEQRKTRKRKGL